MLSVSEASYSFVTACVISSLAGLNTFEEYVDCDFLEGWVIFFNGKGTLLKGIQRPAGQCPC